MIISTRILRICCVVLGLAWTQTVDAKDKKKAPDRSKSVAERSHPRFDPIGLRMGSFLVFPKLTVEETFDDNIYAANTGEESDYITDLIPELMIRSDWNRHQLNLRASADIGLYKKNEDENFEDYKVSGDGRLDISRALILKFAGGYKALHEPRGDPNADSASKEPTLYDTPSGSGDLTFKPNRFSIGLGGDIAAYGYDNGTNSVSGATIVNKDRDRRESTVYVRTGYEMLPEYEAFLKVAYNERTYDDSTIDGDVNRDSDGTRLDLGLAIDITSVISGNIFAGYFTQDYDSASLKDIEAVSGGADLKWNVSRLTTVNLNFMRSIQETTTTGASSFIQTSTRASLDHELLRNLVVGANGKFTDNDYKGITRNDDTWDFGGYLRYKLSPNFHFGGEYAYKKRDLNIDTNDYTQNTFLVRLSTQM